MGCGVHFGIEPYGGQGRFQLMGNVRSQRTGAAAFLFFQLPGSDQPVLQFADLILEHINAVFPQSHVHGFSPVA